MGLLDKLKERTTKSSSDTHEFPPPTASLPLEQAIPRYRKQRGLNLGSWFVQERWINSSTFAKAVKTGQSDYDIAKGEDAKSILEHHWDSWIVEEDWIWMKERGFSSVRIPVSRVKMGADGKIGYYHLCGAIPHVLRGTDFEKFQSIFEGAWGRIEKAIETAGRYGFGVLIGVCIFGRELILDLHAAAGAQNADGKLGCYSTEANTQLILGYQLGNQIYSITTQISSLPPSLSDS
jgi:glucan 1,3-beta-glucosidase